VAAPIVRQHLALDALEASLGEIRASPADHGRVELIVRRPEVDKREALDECRLDPANALVGDTWPTRGSPSTKDGRANPDRQITLMNARVAALVAGTPDRRPLAGDQLYVDLDLSATNLPPGTRLAVGEAVIRISAEPHLGCHKFAARFGADALRFVNSAVGRELNLRGVNAKVVVGGTVRPGDTICKLGWLIVPPASRPIVGSRLAALLPLGIAGAEAAGEVDTEDLDPEEAAGLEAATDRRRREFAEGRACARLALRALGRPPEIIRRGPKREPVWPPGIVGSITHCADYRAAAVAEAWRWAALGIDAERHEPLPPRVHERILTAEEQGSMETLDDAIAWDRVVFSAKEALYKAWFPLTRRWLGMRDAVITLDPAAGELRATLAVEGPPLGPWRGRFAVDDELVVTAVAIPRPSERVTRPAAS